MSLLDSGKQTRPFSQRYQDFGLTEAYRVVENVRHLRAERGDKSVGRKIGFTNRAIWKSKGISAPIWNYVFDSTVIETGVGEASIDARTLPEAKIEPEVVLHLSKRPAPGMSVAEVAECIDWAAPGFEIVFSIFPNWDFAAADAAAAYGVHAALFVGEPMPIGKNLSDRIKALSTFTTCLSCDDGVTRLGSGADVLGGPLQALVYLIAELENYAGCQPLQAGELVTTGTLTEAMPIRVGQKWTASFEGIDFRPLHLSVR
ncbi:2-keto-4-pentenoate hydratase [Notoacmeibacter sp. MSK16QG-6]|uniref:2-keto-4-pentenoate hydratase n=1 Tax=Notoacmeibacter sp. MSK16QG-6 TaxID=2957982 RepID=UPI0020A1EF88|nr:hydratase [Notoacmeibacter sp. MSK16QG-6]MCP1199121.1 hydratase [Notoacmeibacter sp. MSK16QG-6]